MGQFTTLGRGIPSYSFSRSLVDEGNRRAIGSLAWAASALLVVSAMLTAQEAPWVSLFNGRDLSGWKPHGQERWVVDKGEILGEALTKEYGYLATEKTYRDFEIKAKFKAEGAGNSGISYHSTLAGVDIKGVQVEVDPNPRRTGCPSGGTCTGGLYESAGRGWLVPPSQEAEKALRIGDWNEMRVLVQGLRKARSAT